MILHTIIQTSHILSTTWVGYKKQSLITIQSTIFAPNLLICIHGSSSFSCSPFLSFSLFVVISFSLYHHVSIWTYFARIKNNNSMIPICYYHFIGFLGLSVYFSYCWQQVSKNLLIPQLNLVNCFHYSIAGKLLNTGFLFQNKCGLFHTNNHSVVCIHLSLYHEVHHLLKYLYTMHMYIDSRMSAYKFYSLGIK